MIFRFSLYGFLKNQRYFEAFLVLAFLEKGLSFFAIGLLVAVRELTVNFLEVPSGAIADVCGRRRVMILAFASYVVSFVAFGLAQQLGLLVAGMVLFGIGDSFRTGTHKAMIFAWLRLQGRQEDRVRVYGYTRSWSKFGSAVSVVIAAVIVLVSDGYVWVFFISIVPYVLAIVNFLGYPRALDAVADTPPSLRRVAAHTWESVRVVIGERRLRRLLVESMGFDGVFDAAKDYLQPVLAATAIAAAGSFLAGSTGGDGWSDTRRTALLVGPVYFVLYLLAGAASRSAHRVSERAGGEERASRVLWVASGSLFAVLTAAGWLDLHVALIAGFVLLHVVHNAWRPVLISRFDRFGKESHGAALLSIENQGRRAATMVLAPLLGLAVDQVMRGGIGGAYWPVGGLGLAAAVVFLVTGRSKLPLASPAPGPAAARSPSRRPP